MCSSPICLAARGATAPILTADQLLLRPSHADSGSARTTTTTAARPASTVSSRMSSRTWARRLWPSTTLTFARALLRSRRPVTPSTVGTASSSVHVQTTLSGRVRARVPVTRATEHQDGLPVYKASPTPSETILAIAGIDFVAPVADVPPPYAAPGDVPPYDPMPDFMPLPALSLGCDNPQCSVCDRFSGASLPEVDFEDMSIFLDTILATGSAFFP